MNNNSIYYAPYDTFVDIETGEFIDMCPCVESDKCSFKQTWIDDGRPSRLDRNILKNLIIEEGERMMK